ncbi:hypothetical protein [Chryseobacterium jejuense]|uniref:hypothetical protein n=1 Tax=Chryseobacterium jejuense TaxID=445960 RepID=UPI001AE4E222|nr:hypothetical protein [Chryseobacterium jejuense]MBP2618363.1 hypothetical protein [Chryseobacterium jejuense]
MNKKFILQLLLVVAVLFFFNSCRTDEVTQNEKRTEREKIEAFVKFENNLTNQKKNSEYISYHKPFKEIIQAFMNKNPAFAQKFQNEVGDIYFDLRSLTYGEASKVIAYPIMKDDKVNAFLIGVVNPQRDWVNFTVAKDNTPEVQRIISKFQNFYNSASVTSRSREKEQPIEEIVIVVETGIPGGTTSGGVTFPYVDHNGFGSGMSGGGTSYGGGAGGAQVPPPQSPCEKIKEQKNKPEFNQKIDDLRGKTAQQKETGYIQKTDGSYLYQQNASTNNNSNSLSLPNSNLTQNKDITGYMHTHVDDFTLTNSDGIEETRKGIKMFSPADVGYFMDMLSNAQAAGRPLDDVYAVMVTTNETYEIRFTGNQYQIKTFTDQQIEGFKEGYKNAMLKSDNKAATFLNFLSEKMNIKATNLYKLNSSGGTEEIKLNGDKVTTTTSDCPN